MRVTVVMTWKIYALLIMVLWVAVAYGEKSEIAGLSGSSQVYEQWNMTFGGTDYDQGACVQQTTDRGYIIIGTISAGEENDDVWLIKTDNDGRELWNKTFGGKAADKGNFVQQTTDGGYIIVGITSSFYSGKDDVWLIKTNAGGSVLWNKTFWRKWDEHSHCVQQTSDGGYIVAAEIIQTYGMREDSNALLIKADSEGNEEWNRTLGGEYGNGIFSVQQTSDHGYIMTGHRGWYGLWLIKMDKNGSREWNTTFGKNSIGFSVQQTADGGYIVAGTMHCWTTNQTMWLIKTDEYGNEIWDVTLGKNTSLGFAVQQTTDGGYIIAGAKGDLSDENTDLWLVKTDAWGNEEWNLALGGTKFDLGRYVQQTDGGGYIVVGETASFGAGSSDVWLVKVEEKTDENIAGFELILLLAAIVVTVMLLWVKKSKI